GFLGIGAGVGVALTVSADLVISSAPAERAGAAAAVSETAYETGLALGVALLGSTVMAIFRNAVRPVGLPGEAGESLSAATEFARGLPEATAEQVLSSVHAAFVSGIHSATAGTAVVLLIAAALAARLRPSAA